MDGLRGGCCCCCCCRCGGGGGGGGGELVGKVTLATLSGKSW